MRFILTLGRRSVRGFLADNCTQMAAAISFYVLFSLFPFLIFIVGVIGLFLRDSPFQRDVVDAVLSFIPLTEDKGRDQVTEAVKGVTGLGSSALGLFGLIGAAWAGSNMFGAIRRSINTAFGSHYRQPLAQQKLVDFAMMAGMGLFFLVSIGATAALRLARARSEDIPLLGDAADWAGPLWDVGSFLVPLTLSFVAFAAVYWIVPAAKTRLSDVWPGALAAALLFEFTKLAFSIYLENFSRYDLVYGSLGAVTAFLFWVYLSANVVLFGAEVASEYPHVRRGDYDRPPGPRRPLTETIRAKVRGLFVRDGGDEESPRP